MKKAAGVVSIIMAIGFFLMEYNEVFIENTKFLFNVVSPNTGDITAFIAVKAALFLMAVVLLGYLGILLIIKKTESKKIAYAGTLFVAVMFLLAMFTNSFTPSKLMAAIAKARPVYEIEKLINSNTINEKRVGGYTPLMIAVIKNTDIEIIRLLVDNGADINAKDNKGNTVKFYLDANKKISDVYRERIKALIS
jgi:FOG: Ankyrin repeat